MSKSANHERVTTSWPAWITSNYMHSRRQTAIDGWQASNDPAICNETDERGCEPEYKDITASYGRSSSAGLLDTSNTASGYETDQSTGSNDRKSSCTSDRRLQGLTLRPASSHSPANKCESRQSIVELAEEDISAHHPPRSMASMSEYVEPTCSLEPNAPPLAGGFRNDLAKAGSRGISANIASHTRTNEYVEPTCSLEPNTAPVTGGLGDEIALFDSRDTCSTHSHWRAIQAIVATCPLKRNTPPVANGLEDERFHGDSQV
ncbi:uncharacterized protein LOC135818958 [Sycon ciliatum]